MLRKNSKFVFVRCTQYQYLIKEGSMSNCSYDVIDEEKSGILDYLFEKRIYPVEKEDLVKDIVSELKLEEEKIISLLDELVKLSALEEINATDNTKKVCIIGTKIINKEMSELLEDENVVIENCIEVRMQDLVGEVGEKVLDEVLESVDEVIVVSENFAPRLFYQINAKCIEHKKALIIGYLDGKEGLLIPLVMPEKSGCYNDFEILREASFHNLIDYQMMKETLIESDNVKIEYDRKYMQFLMINIVMFLRIYSQKKNINSFAYSFDFERMVNSKIKLMKFPNCPSCQGDLNITHPFI